MILSVGLVCVDVIYEVDGYPVEDSDQRVLSKRSARGGNEANVCQVLAALGVDCEFLGCLGTDQLADFVTEGFSRGGIRFDHCPRHSHVETPNSAIIVNKLKGTRTILHSNQGMPELTPHQVEEVVGSGDYSWIHLGGRHNKNHRLTEVAQKIKGIKPETPISLEVEKVPRFQDLSEVVPYADVIFVSKEVAQSQGYCTMKETVSNIFRAKKNAQPLLKSGARVICPWGDKGAAGMDADGTVFEVPAYPPAGGVVDTIGAGDTFVAATVASLSKGLGLRLAVDYGCRVAGAKVGVHGFNVFSLA